MIGALYAGGAERQLAKLMKELNKERFEVEIASFYGTGSVGRDLELAGFHVHYFNPEVDIFNTNVKEGLLATIKSFFELRKLIKKFKPMIVHSYLPYANLISRFAVIGSHSKNISSIRVKEIGFSWHNIADRLTRFLVKHYTTNSYTVKDFIHKKCKISLNKISVIRNGLNVKDFIPGLSKFSAKSLYGLQSKKVVSMIANLRDQKDHETLIDAISLLNNPGITCLLIGGGANKESLMSYAKCNKNIVFCGERKDIPELLNATDVFVLSTFYEGSPNVLMEAMAAQVPVVASDIPEINEFLEHNVDALLVQRDSNAMAKAIKNVLEDSALRTKLVRNSFSKVQLLFNIQQTTKKTQELYVQTIL